ncbi:cadmium-translocating P-type ATPase [Peteryoungia desertarenae]|uniref:Cadmium-translocating P-type ATPase n=1 Tax=Peteryoungia desertarenae TaxID=1813451 RepID=A0ABX6QPZ6_9HYPH|nr:cation-translocating P-type ATPase [Peteryoungia desertarenae]QLF70584.1 cadmium-translocating P-type ATPase [Peteryoungia desertarenae]
MSCCAAGTEGALDLERAPHKLPSAEELVISSRSVGPGLMQTDLAVPAVHCGTCITTVEQALRALPQVERARVNLSTKRVSVVWRETVDGVESDPVDLPRAIAATGYDSHLFTAAEQASDTLRNQLIRAVAVSGFAATNIMLLSVSVWSGADAATRDLFHWISAMICAPALIYAGRFFYQSAWNAIRHGRTNMDVPIAIGITLSYFASLWETMNHGEHAYFDATASLLFFLLIGRTLDHVMRDRARSAISGLARLNPRGAMVVGIDGSREYRAIDEISVGDQIAIAAGDRIPVDGRVIGGGSDIDMSIVNGESAPVPVKPGDLVQAGTLSLTGSLTIEATATARNSFLSEIINLMEAAEGGRARYRRIADRAAQYYSPVVHLLAISAFFAWGFYDGDWKHAMMVAIAVLIITCPCALGLAVPVVQVVAAGRLFKAGIMVKDGSAMERLAEIDMIAFDKTGTLTLGRPKLVADHAMDPNTMALAAGLAVHSRHPLSQALARAQAGPVTVFDGVKEIPGSGIVAHKGEDVYRLGNRRFACEGQGSGRADSAYSEVVLSKNMVEIAAYRFEDMLRPHAVAAIADVKRRGFTLGILSGDRAPVVSAIAGKLGIANWKADLSPKEKAGFCAEAETEGAKLLMVGDGINDAPALTAAHVSMAPATAADVGRQAADFVFMRDGLDAVPFAIEASQRAGRLIKENFALAIGYNVIAVPIALLGYATPLIAAVAMSTSSIIVVVNALRLNRLTIATDTLADSGSAVVSPSKARFAA